jgi:AcrR family transcriptional regulator
MAPVATERIRAPRRAPAGQGVGEGPPPRRPPTGQGLGERPPPRRGRPPRLTRDGILTKAIELLDAEGMEALTMRRLGAELGVEAMSLYRHITSKDVLLDGIAGQLMAEVNDDRRDFGGDWVEAARRLSIGFRAVALAHPAAFGLIGLRALNEREIRHPIESLLAGFRAAGFAPDRAVAAYRLLASYVRGFVLIEIAGFTVAPELDRPDARNGSAPADPNPTIAELAGELGVGPTEAQFRSGLETILTGLRREIEATR